MNTNSPKSANPSLTAYRILQVQKALAYTAETVARLDPTVFPEGTVEALASAVLAAGLTLETVKVAAPAKKVRVTKAATVAVPTASAACQ
ncbi:MAG: hypothetical protein EBT03_08165 [Betaproteobacteria bacterium]|nr:hypothetical protein [Betaproteobacteria bacterium]